MWGSFKNGIAESKRVEYNENGNKIYEGNLINQKYEGKGIEYYENGKRRF